MRRQERERIDVPLVVGRRPHSEVHKGLGEIHLPTRPDGAHDRGLGDQCAALHPDGAEVHEGCGVAERRLDRDRLAPGRNRAREGDDPIGRRQHRRAGRGAEIHAAVLPARVRVGAIERERPQDGSVHRPGPRTRGRHRQR